MLARYPLLFLPIARRRGWGEVISDDTEFVIEGYPRSGNTFATAAFAMSKVGPDPKVAHHTHSAAQVIAAARRGIPVLVLIRRPEDAVISVLIQQPGLSMSAALRAYIGFYGPLLRHRRSIVVATFEEVVRDFGAVTRKVNERFATTFPVFEHTEKNVRRALAMIEEEERRRFGSGPRLHLRAAFPSSERDRMKPELRGAYRSEDESRLRDRADRLYNAFTQGPES
jgi:hypothetical protein